MKRKYDCDCECDCECKHLTLYRGDDSDFGLNQELVLVLDPDVPADGCSAHFAVFGFRQDFPEVPQDRRLFLVFPASETAKFPLGMANGALWLLDGEGKRRTVSNAPAGHGLRGGGLRLRGRCAGHFGGGGNRLGLPSQTSS